MTTTVQLYCWDQNVYYLFVNDKTTSQLVESRSISENNINIKRESAIPTYKAYRSSSYFHTTNIYRFHPIRISVHSVDD